MMIAFGMCLIGQTGAGAGNSYVTDSFQITLRTGPSIQNKILIMLNSGQPLEVLETKDDWSHVRLLNREENTEGWVMSRYLITRQPWENQARYLERENTALKNKLSVVEKEYREVSGREQETTGMLKEQTGAFDALQRKYEVLKKGSADYLKLKEELDTTNSSLKIAQKRVEDLTRQNDILLSSQRNRWFGMGALVLLCGLLIGLMMGRHQKKPRSTVLFD